jgi:hypothetical protein
MDAGRIGQGETQLAGDVYMIPGNLYMTAAICIATALVSFGAGWGVNGWRLGAQIADLKAEYAESREKLATDALDTIKADTARVTEAADRFIQHQTTLSTSFAAMRQEFRNANRNPLPADCRPDTVRMQYLESAISAANEAIAGSKPGPTVPTAPGNPAR